MMTRKYEKPSLEVIMLEQTNMLMTSGPVGASMDGVFKEIDLSRDVVFPDDDLFLGDE
jgi:hypothetical protein